MGKGSDFLIQSCVEVSASVQAPLWSDKDSSCALYRQKASSGLLSNLVTLHADHMTCSLQTADSSNPEREDAQPLAWKAPRTGRIIRSIHTGEPNGRMTITCSSCDSRTDPTIPYSELQHNVAPLSPSRTSRDSPSRLMSLDTNSLIAEALYIARPLVHSKHSNIPLLLRSL